VYNQWSRPFDYTVKFFNKALISEVYPLISLMSGGINITVSGSNLNMIQNPVLVVYTDRYIKSDCKRNSYKLVCPTPSVPSTVNEIEAKISIMSKYGCKDKQVNFNGVLKYIPDPRMKYIDSNAKYSLGTQLIIEGEDICHQLQCDNQLYVKEYVKVLINNEPMCRVNKISKVFIECTVLEIKQNGRYPVQVKIGGYTQDVGEINYQSKQNGISQVVVIAIVAVVMVVIIMMVTILYKCSRKMDEKNKEVKEIHFKLNKMESEVAKTCKETFAELQTDTDDGKLSRISLNPSYHDYRIYLIRILFPDPKDSDKLIDSLLLSGDKGGLMTPQRRKAIQQLNNLMSNHDFVVSFIHALESNSSKFTMKDKAMVAGLVLIVLQDRLSHATRVLETLLAELIAKMSVSNYPKLLFRRTESVAEKMLTHWFSMLLHKFLINGAGESLFALFKRICQMIDKGPVDCITNDARYSLSEDKLLRQSVDNNTVSLKVRNYYDNDQRDHIIKVLSCDSISQVKRKILDFLYVNVAYSQRIQSSKIDLEWQQSQGNIILRDDDLTTNVDGEWRQINTIQHYKIEDNSIIAIIPKKAVNNTLQKNYSKNNLNNSGLKHHDSTTRLLPAEGSLPRKKQNYRSETPMSSGTTVTNQDLKYYHLIKPSDQEVQQNSSSKMVAEVYLTRLLAAKVAVQKHVDDLMESIFSVEQRAQTLPLAVRHLFDFIDREAEKNGVHDYETIHTWKTNCLPLRFWVNLIKNPEFIFDIYKSSIVDSCLSVIGQTFMDSCVIGQHELTKDSPTNKLLYAKEIPKYKSWVHKFYADIKKKPNLPRRQIDSYLDEESRAHMSDFNTESALIRLFSYIQKYSPSIHAKLDQSRDGKRLQLSNQLRHIEMAFQGNHHQRSGSQLVVGNRSSPNISPGRHYGSNSTLTRKPLIPL